MVDNKAKEYYRNLAKQYLFLSRRYVRKYDYFIKKVANLVLSCKPNEILDIGQGVGNAEEIILKKNPEIKITCLDTEPGMVHVTKETLSKYKKIITILNKDVRKYKPKKKFDVIFSNMTLHNIPHENKNKLIKNIYLWLNPKGTFIWGDLITFKDLKKVKAAFDARKRFAISNGEDPKSEFFVKNFYKEENLDYTLTPERTKQLIQKAGFKDIKQVWEYDNFGLFIAKK